MRKYKIYEKDGYTYVHYDGFPEGVKIKKNERLYNYEWGWMTVTKDGKYYEIHDEDWSLLVDSLWNGTIVQKDGKYGMIDPQGKEVLPCVFDQIEKLRESVFGRLNDSYWEFRIYRGGHTILRGNYSDTGFYVKNGKKGWQVDGKAVVPAIYDDIQRWNDSNYYEVLQNGKWSYVKENGDPVLTRVREIEGVDATVPFPFFTHENDVLVLQEYVGHEDEEDNNVVLMDGVWQRLDRISGKEICQLLVNPEDEKPMTDADLEEFNNNFSYEYAAYQVTSSEPQGVIDCLKKLQSMDLHSNSWHYIVKVWKPVGEAPTAEELRFLRYEIAEHEQLGKLHFAFGRDKNLRPGESKMFVVTHYNERCWPPTWEMHWWGERSELSLTQIKRRLKELRKIINKDVLDPYKEEVWNDIRNGNIYGITYSEKRTWRETVKVLEYFKELDPHSIGNLYHEADEINRTLTWKSPSRRAICAFHFRKLKWLLENGADINAHHHNLTALDFLVGNAKNTLLDKFFAKDKVYNEQMRAKITTFLIEHGAKTMQQIKEEEAKNKDYRVELQRMG